MSRLTKIIRYIQLNADKPLQPRLGNVRNSGSYQVLSQQHTKHRRLRRIIPQQLCQLKAGCVGAGVQQKPLIAPQKQNDLIPSRLLHLVNS